MTELRDVILVLNAGSSSIKFQLFDIEDGLKAVAKGLVEEIGLKPVFTISGEKEKTMLPEGSNHKVGMDAILGWIEKQGKWQIAGAGHRIVHGGPNHDTPLKLDHEILEELIGYTPLAPLHQPHNIAPVKALFETNPDLIQVGCFDTAFHANQDKLHKTFALPQKFYEEGVRKYGFHGLSYEYIAGKLKEDRPDLHKGKVVVAHLGNGDSMCAIDGGKSVTSSMGMSVIEGLPMGTRTGSIDPGAVLHIMDNYNMDTKAVNKLLTKESGLKGLSGISSDMRVLTEEKEKGNKDAAFAIDYFILKTAQMTAQMAVAMGGMDALVFTAGIGEHSEIIRKGVVERLKFMPKFETLVIPTNEELMIAYSTAQFLTVRRKDARSH